MMNLFFVAFVVSFLSLSFGGTIIQDDLSFQKKIAETHFGKLEDFKNVDIPSEKESSQPDSTHPYHFNLNNDGSGNYNFGFKTFNQERFEKGELKNAGTDNEIQVVKGQYSYLDYDPSLGLIKRTIGYIADENGYRPFLINISPEAPIRPSPPSPLPSPFRPFPPPLPIPISGPPSPPVTRPPPPPVTRPPPQFAAPVPGTPATHKPPIETHCFASLLGGSCIG